MGVSKSKKEIENTQLPDQIPVSHQQKALAKNIYKGVKKGNGRFSSLRSLLIASGYSELNSERNAYQILASPGVRKHLQSLGLKDVSVDAVVAEILFTGEERNRLAAADIFYKVLGRYAPTKSESVNVNLIAHALSDIQKDGNKESGSLIRETNGNL